MGEWRIVAVATSAAVLTSVACVMGLTWWTRSAGTTAASESKSATLARVVAFRVGPGAELKEALVNACETHGVRAGAVLTCVGSCTGARVRLAAATALDADQQVVTVEGKHEIVSLVGTVAQGGECHLHVSLADEKGKVFGGHLVGDMVIFTTAEVVLAECEGLEWLREMDDRTGFRELVVAQRASAR